MGKSKVCGKIWDASQCGCVIKSLSLGGRYGELDFPGMVGMESSDFVGVNLTEHHWLARHDGASIRRLAEDMAVATSFHENLHMAAEQKSTSPCCCGMIGRPRQVGMHQWSLFWSSGRGALAWDVSGLCAFGATARYMSMIWSAGPQSVVSTHLDGVSTFCMLVLPGCAPSHLLSMLLRACEPTGNMFQLPVGY